MAGGVPVATVLSTAAGAADASKDHKGFPLCANQRHPYRFRQGRQSRHHRHAKAAIELINSSAPDAALILHTGDITHLSKPAEFDTAAEVLKGFKIGEFHTVPGEHDVLDQTQSAFLDRYGKASGGKGYYSFDHGGVHFVALVNVMEFKPGGQGRLGDKQLEWLEDDLKGRSASQPLVIFTHIPLWSLYPQWGWSTEDWPQAMSYVKRFGSVTVLNGHIHQVVQKVEGDVRYYAARSTAYHNRRPAWARGRGR